jgi:hypothetical protein
VKYRRIDENGDYVFGNGKYDFLEDVEAVPQAIKTKLNLFQGEWWEDLSEGTPFYQDIAGQFIKSEEDKDIVTRIYCNRISDVEAVNSFISVNSEFDNEKRKYSMKADINTIYGVVNDLEVV